MRPQKPVSSVDTGSGSGLEVPIAILRVQIISCNDLETKGRNGFSNPFVVVSTLGKEFKTPVCKRNLNPVYNPQEATFDFPIYMSLVQRLGSVNLKFVVWDKDFIGKDFLGKNTLSVNEWFKRTALAFYDPENRPIVVGLLSSRTITILHGSMNVKIGFIATHHSTTQPDFRNILNTLANPVLAPQPDHVGIVTLVIWGANELPDWPTGWDMDPYVKVTVGDEVKCTQVIRHDRNPIWDKQLVFHVRQSELADPIVLSVFDWDRFSSDDHVGDFRINISQLIATTSRKARTTEFFSDDLTTMFEFVNVPLATNPKRSYKRIPTLTFRAGYQSYEDIRKLGQRA